MRIFLIIPTLGKGGAERVVSNLSLGLSRLGYEVFVVILCGPVSYSVSGQLINFNIQYSSSFKLKIFFNLVKSVFRIKQLLKKYQPKYIFSFMEFANFCAILAAGNKACISERASIQQKSFFNKRLTKLLYPFSRKIISVSKDLKCDLIKNYHLKNVETIYNPLNFELVDSEKLKKINIDYPFILSVGRLSSEKNHIVLIDAYLLLYQKYQEKIPKLVIAGDGVLRKKLENYVAEKKIHDRVVFVGNVSNPYAYMMRCKIFVLPSLYEGFPNVLIEAMACGAVCIATDCPTGPNEIIKHGVNGFLVKNNDVELMKEAMEECLSDNFDAEKIKLMAVQSVQMFSLKSICDKYLELCKN